MPGSPARAAFSFGLAIGCLFLCAIACPAMAAAPTDEKLTVLSYHEIAEPGEALIPDYAVTPTNFVRQIDWLRNNGFNFVSVNDVLADQAGKAHLPRKQCCSPSMMAIVPCMTMRGRCSGCCASRQ